MRAGWLESHFVGTPKTGFVATRPNFKIRNSTEAEYDFYGVLISQIS